MMCNKQTMIKTGIGLVAILGVAYAVLPQFRAYIVGLSPILLTLLCPLSMVFMMKGMASSHKQEDKETGTVMTSNRPEQAEPEAEAPGWFVHSAAAQRRYRFPSPRR